ncbi:MAG: cytoplasmic protein [Deltaproteobacteria bacterium]|nr:cytoplasmic protein [Deltaproteobacteria bacterium]
MKNILYLVIGILAISILVFVTKTATAQDVVQAAPEQFKVLLENEHVRVLEFRMKPGDKQEMHTHPATVHIELTPTKVKIINPDGKALEVEGKQGEALWVGPVKHTVENIGNNEIHGYIVELKEIPYETKGK